MADLLDNRLPVEGSLEQRLVEALNPPAAHRAHVEQLVHDIRVTVAHPPLFERLTQAAELAATRHAASSLLDRKVVRTW